MVRLRSCGSNSHGQAGQISLEDSSNFLSVELPSSVKEIINLAFGATHTIALIRYDSSPFLQLLGVGSNSRGQLGPQFKACRIFQPVVLQNLLNGLSLEDRGRLGKDKLKIFGIASAWETTFIHLQRENAGDIVLAMGSNDWGELGAKDVTESIRIINFDNVVGPSERLEVMSLVAGPRHVIVHLKITGLEGIRTLLVGWGASRHGQLDPNSISNVNVLPIISLPLELGFSSIGPLDNSILISLGRDFTALKVSPSNIHLFGKSSNRILKLSGSTSVLLPSGFENARIIEIRCYWSGMYCILEDEYGQHLFGFGSNSHAQLGTRDEIAFSDIFLPISKLPTFQSVKQLVCGSEHALVLLEIDSGLEVWGWGWNEHGNLNDGERENVTEPKLVFKSSSPRGEDRIQQVWGGNATTWIATSE